MRTLKVLLLTSSLALSGFSVQPHVAVDKAFPVPDLPTLELETLKLEAQPTQASTSTTTFRSAFAFEQITLDATAGGIGFTAATINPTVTDQPSAFSRAELAVVNCNGAQARYRLSGTVTSSSGMLIQDGDTFLIYGYANIVAFKGIRTGAVSVACDATFYRNR